MQVDFIVQYTNNILPSRKRTSSKGWLSFNAACCTYNGETADTKGRGGVIASAEGGINYHCFNCGFKTGYQPGRPLSYKFRKFLSWYGASEVEIRRLVIEAIRVKDELALTNPVAIEAKPIEYKARHLPLDAYSFTTMLAWHESANNHNYPPGFIDSVKYIGDRKIDMQKYEFLWTPDHEHKLSHRVIIPFKWQHNTIGYTGRAFVDGIKPKYFNQYDSDFVFNMDEQKPTSKFVIVCEGPFDAMSVDGVAILGSVCSEQQADIIDGLGREVIVVPDFDISYNEETGKKKWSGVSLLEQAIEYGWSVSFPVWSETCKDINEAVVKYGKLFVLKAILDSVETSRLKIELRKKKLYN